MNDDNTNHNLTFSCDICKHTFALHYQLKMHMEKHHKKPTQVNSKSNQCKFCGKQFKLNFVLNRHIEKYHINLTECEICKCIIEKSLYNEHMQTHENGTDKKINSIPNLKLCKLNGVWKSKPNCVYKCKLCFKKFDSQNNLTEHMKIHGDNDSQLQCVDEFNGRMRFHNKSHFNCQKCNLRFDNKQNLNIHMNYCTKSSQNIWSKFRGQVKAIIQTSYVCTKCGTSYTNPLLLKHHITSGCKDRSCQYCGTIFTSKELWSKHMDDFQKYRNCININSIETSVNILPNQNLIVNNINQSVNNGNSVCTNVSGRNSSNQIDIAIANSYESTVQTVSYNLMENDSGVNVSYENSLCTNIIEVNNSDQTETGTVSSIESMVQDVSQNSVVNNYIINIKKEKDLCTDTVVTSSLDHIGASNSNGSIVQSVSPHNSIGKGSNVNVKKEKSSCTTTSSINNLDQIHAGNNNESIAQTMNNFCINIKKEKDSDTENCRTNLECLYQTDEANNDDSTVQVTSQNSLMNYCDLNIKKEKGLQRNVNENINPDLLDAVPNRFNELNVQTVSEINMINNVRVKREPEDHSYNTIIKENRYFSIKKLPYNKNVSSIAANQNCGPTSNSNIMYVCKICNTSSEDVHSFALHMSSHLECSLHECVVCETTFLTVLLWTNHMNYHQQQVDLNLSNSEINPTEIEPMSSTNITTYSESIKPPAHSSTMRNGVNNSSKLTTDFKHSSTSKIKTVNNNVKKFRKSFSCKVCKNIFPSKLSLMTHQTLHDKSKQFCCKFCNRTFSSRGPCTNHEKSHDPNGYRNAIKSIEIHKPTEILNNSVQIKNINVKPILTIHKKKKNLILKPKYYICEICRKRFAKRCYLTNHLKLRHHINSKSPNEQVANSSNLNSVNGNINDMKSINKCNNMELPTELTTNSSLSLDIVSNELVNDIPHQQSTVSGHITSHSGKIFTCQFCNKQFNQKSSLSNHIKCHSNEKHKKNKSVNSKNLNVKNVLKREYQEGGNYNNSEFDNSSLIESNTVNSTMTATVMDHANTYSDHNLHKCRFCDKQFAKKSSYSNHIKSHNNKKVKHVKNKNLNEVKMERNEEYQQGENCNIPEFINSSFIESNIENLSKKNRMWFPCDACEKKFSTPFQLIIHRRSHCGVEPYLCKLCNKSYNVRHRWNRHLKSHYWRNKLKNKSTKPINASKLDTDTLQSGPVQHKNQLKCGYCKKEYFLISHWKKHLSLSKECRRHCKSSLPEFTNNQAKENFAKSTRFECHICKKTYSTSYNRKIHIVNVHKLLNVDLGTSANINVVEPKKKLKIETIQQNSKSVNQKKSRLISNDTKNQCHLCGKCYSNRANLYRHQTISHTMDVKVINCTICDKSFKHKYSFREHLRSKHNQLLSSDKGTVGKKSKPRLGHPYIAQYLCKICKVEFSDNASLENHIKIHTRYQYECVDCGQKFETNATLGEHILNSHCASTKLSDNNRTEIQTTSSQSTNDNLKCKICSKVVKSASYLPVHMRIHTGVKPFKCDVCNMAFRFKPNLRIHKRVHYQPNLSS